MVCEWGPDPPQRVGFRPCPNSWPIPTSVMIGKRIPTLQGANVSGPNHAVWLSVPTERNSDLESHRVELFSAALRHIDHNTLRQHLER